MSTGYSGHKISHRSLSGCGHTTFSVIDLIEEGNKPYKLRRSINCSLQGSFHGEE